MTSDHATVLDTVKLQSRIGIGDLCRTLEITPRALRFYEERGLLEARRDRGNMRYYDPVTCDRIVLIVRLRRAGLPLPDIREVMRLQDAGLPIVEYVRDRLQERLRGLDCQRQELQGALVWVETQPRQVGDRDPAQWTTSPPDRAPRVRVEALG